MLTLTKVSYREDGRYEIRCSEGHNYVTILQEQKFEVLFQIGAHALLDGYYREAVTSFTASLEQFYEFAIRIFLLESGVPGVEVDRTWKHLANSSERQLGAFIMLWLRRFGESPALLSQDNVSFRNRVVHQGHIPTEEEARSYGNGVFEMIRPQMRRLQASFPDFVRQLISAQMRKARGHDDPDTETAFMSGTTMLCLANSPDSDRTFAEHLELVRLVRQRTG